VKQLKSQWAEIDKLKKTAEKEETAANKRLATLTKLQNQNQRSGRNYTTKQKNTRDTSKNS
jgi:hypothetical protein